MKNIITFILVSLLVSTITAQTLLVGNYKAGWQANTATCCVPTLISINSTNNSLYQASFTFTSNYTANNVYCGLNNITGNFMSSFSFNGTGSAPFYSGNETTNTWTNANSTISITSVTTFSEILGQTFGPFFSVNIANCSYGILAPSSPSYSSGSYLNNTGNYTNVITNATVGYNASNTINETVNTCCIPTSVSIGFINNSSLLNLSATFSPANLNSTWCILGGINSATVSNQTYNVIDYTSSLTEWASSTNPFVIGMETNSSGNIQASFFGVNNSVCHFTMSLTNFGGKLAASFSIISLLIITLW